MSIGFWPACLKFLPLVSSPHCHGLAAVEGDNEVEPQDGEDVRGAKERNAKDEDRDFHDRAAGEMSDRAR
jgi:hypothetical protein